MKEEVREKHTGEEIWADLISKAPEGSDGLILFLFLEIKELENCPVTIFPASL